MRKTSKELEQIKKDLNINTIWSWSRLNTYMNDPYIYFLKYILNIPEDRNDSIYAVSGGAAHSLIEDFYRGKLDYQGMLEKYEEKLFEFNMLGLMYDRTDKEKNEKIASKYEDCMRHFFLNHEKITDKPLIEQFVLIKVGNQYFQSYIDFMNIEKRNSRKKIIITDWKSSSLYKGDKLLNESGQLLLYGEGVHQKTNLPYEDIIIRFNFMKYVNVTYTLKKNKEKKLRQIERNCIGEKLKSNAKVWLREYGYEDELDYYLELMEETNGIECLPKEVQEMFEINDCYVEVEFNKEIVDNHKQNILNTIKEIKLKEKEYEQTKNNNVFWKDVDNSSSYFHANLSGYSAKIHRPYKKYLEELDDNINRKISDDISIANEFGWMDQII